MRSAIHDPHGHPHGDSHGCRDTHVSPDYERYGLVTVRPERYPADMSIQQADRAWARRQVRRLVTQSELTLAARLMERLNHRWFRTTLRACLPDGDREMVMMLRTVRGVRLLLFWHRRRS